MPRLHLTDGVIELRPRTLDDVDQQLAGQDSEIEAWLDWDPATLENVTAMIEACIDAEARFIPRFDLGIYDVGTGVLVGNSLANFGDPLLAEGEVNLAYAVFPAWRGRKTASRVLELLCGWLETQPAAELAVLKIDPANAASRAVAERSGFLRAGSVVAEDVTYDRYVRAVA